MQWNELKQQPEIVEAIERIEKRKKQEAEERKRQEAECKRDEQTRQSRFQSVLIRFINEGHSSLGKFSQTERINFNDKEANAIYYGLHCYRCKRQAVLKRIKEYRGFCQQVPCGYDMERLY